MISQFRSQRQTEVFYLKRQVDVLLNRSTERLVRLSGALASIFDTDDTQNHHSPETVEFNPANANYAKLGFELDIHEIGFFTAGSNLIWHWSQSGNLGSIATENWLHKKIIAVEHEEKPASLLVCTPNCLLYAFVPILDHGRKIGVMTISQSIADFIIEFNAVTNTDFVLTMPIQPGIQQDVLNQWSTRIAGITNADRITPLLQNMTERFHGPQVFENGLIVKWNEASYDIHYIPLANFLDTREGAIFFISDVTDRLNRIDSSVQQGFIITIISLFIAELGLIYLVGVPTRRIKELAHRLPLLAAGNYNQIRDYFGLQQRSILLRDEVDILYDNALTLSKKLDENSKAIAKKNLELEMERDFIQGLLTSAQVLVVTQTRDGIIRMANEFAMQLTGFTASQIDGKNFSDLISDKKTGEMINKQLRNMSKYGQRRFEHEHTLISGNGKKHQIVWVHAPLNTEHADGSAILSVGLDVTKRVEAESKMRWLADHDQLTGLVNRRRFQEEISRVMLECKRSNHSSALLVFDLDHFKEINDTSGHAAGDSLLRLITHEIQKRTRKSDIVARLGGDEFGILMPHTHGNGATIFAQELIELVRNMVFPYGTKRHRIGVSVGIALLPHHGNNVHELMANADMAMFEAKRAGRSQVQLFTYDQGHADQLTRNVYWKDILLHALNEEGLFFHLQPIIEIPTEKIIYHEALLRLRLNDGRIALPCEFLDSGQRAGLSYEIDLYVIRLALKTLTNDKIKRLSINLSTSVFANDNWIQLLIEAVVQHNLDPNRLIFEITETAIIADMEKATKIASIIIQHGFKFAVDDFGAGFSSLYYLKQLPVAYVKLDRSLVKHIAINKDERDFVNAITTMVHAFGKQVVGEGVEDNETLTILKDLNVDFAQGFYIGYPNVDN
ncbi:MAG: EAL domain-containing protein [Nitrosomonas sp.]|nr:EAL domain-containing protein [Nitrosomonas sp.]